MGPYFSERIAMKAKIGKVIVYAWIIIFSIRVFLKNRKFLKSIPKEFRMESYQGLLTNAFERYIFGNERSFQ